MWGYRESQPRHRFAATPIFEQREERLWRRGAVLLRRQPRVEFAVGIRLRLGAMDRLLPNDDTRRRPASVGLLVFISRVDGVLEILRRGEQICRRRIPRLH